LFPFPPSRAFRNFALPTLLLHFPFLSAACPPFTRRSFGGEAD